jgi:small GTP-binding protein
MSSFKNKKKNLLESKNTAFDVPVKASTRTVQDEENNSDDDPNKSGSDMEVKATTYPLKITIVGSSSVGKTSIIKRYIENKFDEASTKATIIAEFKAKKINIDPFTEAELQIWDTAGQEIYRSVTKNYLHDSNGILIVFDLTNEKTFEDLDSWIEDINNTVEEKVPKILIGNKSDLPEKKISFEQASKYAEEHKMKYQIVSAKNGINIDLLFETIGNECIKAIQERQKELEEEEEENKGRPTGLSGQFENNEKISLEDNEQKEEQEQKSKKCC